jgi:hypothetical protein
MSAAYLAGRLTYAVAGQVDWRVRPRILRRDFLGAARSGEKRIRSARTAAFSGWQEDTVHERHSDCLDSPELPTGAKPSWPKAEAFRMQFISSFLLPGAKGNACAPLCTTSLAEGKFLPPEWDREPLLLDATQSIGGREGQFKEPVRSESIWLFLHLLRNQVSKACTAWPNVAGNLPATVCGKRPARKNERSLPCRPIDVCRWGSG